MSMKNVEKFFDLAKTNEELSKKLIKINNHIQEKESQDLDYNQFVKEEIVPLAQEFGVTFSVDDFVKYTKSKLPKELSDEESANVSGGVSLKTAAITFGTLLSVSLGAAAFLGMGGLEASALETAETASSSQGSNITSKAAHPKAVDNISDDEVNEMGPKIVTGGEKVYFDGEEVKDETQKEHLKAVRDKFDQQFEQNLKEQKIVQDLAKRTNNIKKMHEGERIDLKIDIRKARRSVKNQELKEKLNDMLNFALKVSQEMDIAERNAEQKQVEEFAERTKNIEKMNKEERIKLKRDIRKAKDSIEDEELKKALDGILACVEIASREMSIAERNVARNQTRNDKGTVRKHQRKEITPEIVQKIKQIRDKEKNIANMNKGELSTLLRDIRRIMNDRNLDNEDSLRELSLIHGRVREIYQKVKSAEEKMIREQAIIEIKEKVENLEDIENMNEEELISLSRLLNRVPVSTRPEHLNKVCDKLNEEFERRAKEEEAQEEQAQKAQLIELGKYVKENRITSLSDVPEKERENFIEDLNEVKENFYYDTNDISSLGEVGQTIINLLHETIAANKKTNGRPFKYREIHYLPRVASNTGRFTAAVIGEIARGKITSMSQVPQRDIEAFRKDITTAVALLQKAGMPIPDAIGVLYKEIISNDKYKINYQKFPDGDINYKGEKIKEGTTEYEILRVEHIKEELEDKGIYSLREVENFEELISDITKYSNYFTENHLAQRPSPKLSMLGREIRENPEYLNVAKKV